MCPSKQWTSKSLSRPYIWLTLHGLKWFRVKPFDMAINWKYSLPMIGDQSSLWTLESIGFRCWCPNWHQQLNAHISSYNHVNWTTEGLLVWCQHTCFFFAYNVFWVNLNMSALYYVQTINFDWPWWLVQQSLWCRRMLVGYFEECISNDNLSISCWCQWKHTNHVNATKFYLLVLSTIVCLCSQLLFVDAVNCCSLMPANCRLLILSAVVY